MTRYITYPSSKAYNPFIRLLNRAIAKAGYLESNENVLFSINKAFKYKSDFNIIHFHWPESYWRSKSLIISLIKAIRFVMFMMLLKALNYKLVFSIHNVVPHFEVRYLKLEKYLRKFIIKHFDLVVGHSKNAYDEMLNTYGIIPQKYVLAQHGIYDNYLEVNAFKFEELENVTQIKLYMAYSLNEYKGSVNFIEQFTKLDENITENFHLILSGKEDENAKKILADKKIRFTWIKGNGIIKNYLSDEELVGLIKVSDLVVLPYKEITTSGAYFLTLTFDKPVIATSLPFFKEYTNDSTSLLFDYYDIKSLEVILQKLIDGWKPLIQQFKLNKEEVLWEIAAGNITHALNDLMKDTK